MKTKTMQLIVACCCMMLGSSCLKDTAYRTYTYKLYRPEFQTSAQVRANIKTAAAQQVTGFGKIYVLGKYIYLNDRGKGIHVINNSNPAKPVNEAFINVPGCEDMAATGHTLYADCYTDLMVLDISNPQQVELKTFIPNIFPDRQYVMGYQIDSGRVIANWIIKDTTVKERMEVGRLFNNMLFMDVASTQSSSNSGGTTKGMGGSMARFAIQSQHLYSVTYNKLNVLDIVVPPSPKWTKTIDLGWGIETIYPFKDKLFIGSNSGMHIYSVSNPGNPEKAGTFEHANVCDPVIADDDFAYVTLRSGNTCNGFTNQLDVVDVANILSPKLLRSYPLTNPHGLSKDGNWLFICDGKDGLKVFDATNANAIKLKKTIDMPDTYDVICSNGLAIVVAEDGLYQFDYSNINDIKLLSKTSITN